MPSVGTKPIRIYGSEHIFIEDYARRKNITLHQAVREILKAKSLEPLIQTPPAEKVERIVHRERRVYGCCICEFEDERPQITNSHQLSEHINPYIAKKLGISTEGVKL